MTAQVQDPSVFDSLLAGVQTVVEATVFNVTDYTARRCAGRGDDWVVGVCREQTRLFILTGICAFLAFICLAPLAYRWNRVEEGEPQTKTKKD